MALDCSGPIYQQSFFIFDPEDVQQNGGFLYYRIPPTEVKVQNLDGDMIILATRNISALVVSSKEFFVLIISKHV